MKTMGEDEKQALFEAAFAGHLNADELETFERALTENEDLRQDYELFVLLREALLAHELTGFRESLKKADQRSKPMRGVKRSLYFAVGIAASILLVFAIQTFTDNDHEKYKPSEIGLPVLMNDGKYMYNEAMNAYKKSDFARANALLQSPNLPVSDTTQYFRAVTMLELGAYDEAFDLFSSIPSGSAFKEKALRFSVYSMLEANDDSGAKSALIELKNFHNGELPAPYDTLFLRLNRE